MALKKSTKIRVRRVTVDDVKALNDQTLLLEFIDKKEKSYVVPVRKGTAKGEAIGFSEQKYKAILHSLRKTKIKDTAKLIGVSYGVLRKWRTEDAFKNELASLQGEFGNVFCKFVLDYNTKQFSGKWRAIPARRVAKLKDVGSYIDDLKESIVGCLMHLWAITSNNFLNEDDFHTILGIADGVSVIDADLGLKIKKLLVERVKTREVPAAIEGLYKLILKLPKKDQKQAVGLFAPLNFLSKL